MIYKIFITVAVVLWMAGMVAPHRFVRVWYGCFAASCVVLVAAFLHFIWTH